MIAIEDDRLPDDFEPEQLEMYHDIYALGMANQALFSHPHAEPMHPAHWQTLCHNFAFYAALARNGDDITVMTEEGEVLMTSEKGTTQ